MLHTEEEVACVFGASKGMRSTCAEYRSLCLQSAAHLIWDPYVMVGLPLRVSCVWRSRSDSGGRGEWVRSWQRIRPLGEWSMDGSFECFLGRREAKQLGRLPRALSFVPTVVHISLSVITWTFYHVLACLPLYCMYALLSTSYHPAVHRMTIRGILLLSPFSD